MTTWIDDPGLGGPAGAGPLERLAVVAPDATGEDLEAGIAPPSDPVVRMSAVDLAEAVRTGGIGAGEVVTRHLLRADEVEQHVRALTRRLAGPHRPGAPGRHRAAPPTGPLAGVPVVVKDNIDVAGAPTTCGSAQRRPVATADATAVSRLRAAGAVVLAHGNMDELAMGASTQTSAFGRSRNPIDLRRSAGGSSGGCAAAVAAHEAPLALGTDTGGSVREPASQCGVVGMAPSPGLVPMHGVVPFARALDRVGPVARSVRDLATLLAVVADWPDLARAGRAEPGDRPLAGLRVGVPLDLMGRRNRPEVLERTQRALGVLVSLGAVVEEVRLPTATRALATYLALTSAACVDTVGRWEREGGIGPEAQRRLRHGEHLRGEGRHELTVANAARRVLRGHLEAAWDRCDLLLSPTMPTTAPRLDEGAHTDPVRLADPLQAPYTDCWTVMANLCSVPSLTLPAGRSTLDGMPVGVMLTAPAGHDALLLSTAAQAEAAGLDQDAR